jgi:protein ImuA
MSSGLEKFEAEPLEDGEPWGLEALRARIRLLERGTGRAACDGLALGLPPLDAALPAGGLPLAALHEIAPGRPDWDDGPVTGFCLALLVRLAARRPGPVLWLAAGGDLYAPGLAAFGFDPARLIEGRAKGDGEVLWAMEEGLRSGALAAVVAEVAELDATAARRLQLAAESGAVPAFLLRRWSRPGATVPIAAATRWRISAAPAASFALPDSGIAEPRPRWQVELLRCRAGRPGNFLMEWDHATGDFSLVAPFCDRPADAAGVSEDGPAEARRAG